MQVSALAVKKKAENKRLFAFTDTLSPSFLSVHARIYDPQQLS
jgi:hypothetical protein